MDGAPPPQWTALSPTLLTMRRTEIAVVGALLAAGAGVALGWVGSPVAAAAAVGAVALGSAAVWWFVRNRFRAWGYFERDEDLEVRRGVMVQRLSVVPYGRMQFVEITAGPVERLFGLATIKLHTAAAGSDARIPGLDPDEAARLRDRLAALGEAKAAGL
ncbi:MAG TPA: PH domain-containing protein [Acidimicrobiales bacterium]|nr:PH domain-containing protein [Acidimicrobiales bacterium]